MRKFLGRLSYTQLILLGFLAVIAAGTLLLCLPVSSVDGTWGDPLGCAFTATSAACVTGLIVYDTFTHWTLFGQLVILLLIQIGGLGLMTVITMFSMMLRRKVNLRERRLLMQSAGNTRLGGMLALVRRILLGTLLCEGVGAVVLALRFARTMPLGQALYYAVFHAISAFCNAGFDLMGRFAPFSSFTAYAGDAAVNLTLMALIVIGGIGFLVWSDIAQHRLRFKEYSLHSKIALATTAVLIPGGALLFLLLERDASFAALSGGERVLAALFQSVTARTAGFNTVDQAALSEGGSLLTMALMFIGASPGSTGGGVKTTTLFVVVMSLVASSRRTGITAFRRSVDDDTVKQAGAIVAVYLFAELAAALLLSAVEPFPLREILYEVISAGGTVGVTMGLTPQLTALSQLVLMLLMFFGRVGGLTLAIALAEQRVYVPLRRPNEKILIG